MSGVETNFTVDSVILENIADYSGFTGDAKLAEKGYVDYLYNLNMGSLNSELDGLRMQVDGITGDLILSQYNTIIEIADQLLNFGETGTTGTIYNLTTSYGLAVGAREVALLGFTGDLAAERDRAVTSEQSLTDKLAQETTAFTNADTAERLARIAADVGLTGGLLTEIADFNSAIAAETAARIVADVGLTGDLLAYQASNDFKLAHITFSGHTGATGHYMNDANVQLKNIKTAYYEFIGATGISVLNSPYSVNSAGGSAEQGSSVSMSVDGMYIAVGNSNHSASRTNSGSVSVYKKKSDGTWSLQKDNNNNLFLVNPSVSGLNQGKTVSLSGDGSKLAVGSTNDVTIWSRNGSIWSVLQTLTATNQGLGNYVSFSRDGSILAASSYAFPQNTTGKVYLYSFNGTTYEYLTDFVGSDNTNGGFGTRVAVSGDGNRVVVSSVNNDNNKGAIWVFVNSNGSWTQEGNKIVPSSISENDYFGMSLDIDYNGNIIIASAGFVDSKGAVWVFNRTGSTWSQTTKISAPSSISNFGRFGSSCSITDDGKQIIVVASQDGTGSIVYYNNTNNTWAINGSKNTFNNITGMSNSDISYIQSIAIGGNLSTGYVFGSGLTTSTYSNGAAFYVSAYDPSSTYSPNSPTDPYYLQLSNKWRITPNAKFSALRFQKYVDGAWTDVATLNKL